MLPRSVDDITPVEMFAALTNIKEESREAYRVSLFSVFASHAKKGTSWEAFLKSFGMQNGSTPSRGKAKGKPDMSNVYRLADHIKAIDQRSR